MAKAIKKQKSIKPAQLTALATPEADRNKLLRLDLGCGKNKNKDGEWLGVDCIKFDGVDLVLDLGEVESFNFDPKKPWWKQEVPVFKAWPWADNSVDAVHSSHFIEHLVPEERIHFVNEVYRILKPGCKATLIAPNWSSMRAYGDLTHRWTPISAFWLYYLSKEWRKINAPHNDGYTCDFGAQWGFSLRQDVLTKHQEVQQYEMSNHVDVCEDIIVTLTKV